MKELLKEKEAEFEAIVQNHRQKIPVKEMAAFLNMKEDNLRTAIVQGRIAGATYTDGPNGNRAFYIFPTPFYKWYFGG